MSHAPGHNNQINAAVFGIPMWLWVVAFGGLLLWWGTATQTAQRRAADPTIP